MPGHEAFFSIDDALARNPGIDSVKVPFRLCGDFV